MVARENDVWIGLEYFCSKGDRFWSMNDPDIIQTAIDELHKLSLADAEDVLDAVVIRAPKAYPAYFGSYPRFSEIRSYTDSIENLFLMGRNGMHRYNNTDHSMLSAMAAVKLYLQGGRSRERIWNINTEEEYHEEQLPTDTKIITRIPAFPKKYRSLEGTDTPGKKRQKHHAVIR